MVNYKNFTPEELNNFVAQDIQRRFEIKDSKLVASGPISILVNTLSNILFDAKQYYHFITRELNVATAQRFNSILFHSSIYDYKIRLALPATVDGYIVIPEPSIGVNQEWRAVIPRYSYIVANGLYFRLKDEIKISYKKTATDNVLEAIYMGQGVLRGLNISFVNDPESNHKNILIYIPPDVLEQVHRQIYKYTIPKYNVGDVVSFDVSFGEAEKIYRIGVYVNDYDNPPVDLNILERTPIEDILTVYPQMEKFDFKLFKFVASPYDKTVFIEYNKDYSGFTITLGNGVHGQKLNFNDELILVVETTSGANGNIEKTTGIVQDIEAYVIDSTTNNTVSSYNSSASFINTAPARGGKDAEDIETIRFNILKKFTERSSLITPLDFQKYFGDINKLAVALAKKLEISNERVVVYKEFRNIYDDSIVDTFTKHLKIGDYSDTYIIMPTLHSDFKDYISPFVYVYKDDVYYAYYLSQDINIPLTRVSVTHETQLIPEVHLMWGERVLGEGDKFYFTAKPLSKQTQSGQKYFVYAIHSSIGVYYLTHSTTPTENYKTPIEPHFLYNNRFILEPILINKIEIIDPETYHIIHTYSVPQQIEPMRFVQTHHIYFDREAYEDAVEAGTSPIEKNYKYILYCPFIEKDTYTNLLQERSDFENYFYEFFKIKNAIADKLLPYNLHVNQTFPNTSTVDLKIREIIDAGGYILENENDNILAQYDINIDILYNADTMNINRLTVADLEVAIKLEITNYLFEHEGINIEIYRTDLIKRIEALFPDIILDVTVKSPKTLVVEDFEKFVDNLAYPNQSVQLTYKDVIFMHPTYFHFDYNNMKINFIIAKGES